MATDLRVDREQYLLDLLQDRGSASTRRIAADLGVSEMTIRRDLSRLEHKGLARRVHGGAVLASDKDPGYWLRHKRFQPQKQAIGTHAATLVKAGQTVYLDTGTTAMEVARGLVRRALNEDFKTRVVTHAVNTAAELVGHPSLAVYQIGGPTEASTFGTTGKIAVEQIENLYFDIFFMGVSGVDPDAGFTNSNPVGVETKRAALRRAREVCVVADSSKWDHVSFATIAPLAAATRLVTDASFPPEAHSRISPMGVEVILAH